MQYYGVLGTGDAKKRVIEEGLLDYTDRSEKSMALVPWDGPPAGGLERVFDWLLDNEMPYRVYFEEGEKPPSKAVERHAEEVIEVRNITKAILRDLVKESGDLLVLFDGDSEEDNKLVLDGIDAGLSVLELNNGLDPLTVEGEEEEESPAAEAPQEEEERPARPGKEDTAAPLTEDEVRAMPVATMRAHARSLGLDITGMRKAEILELLLKTIDSPEPMPRSEDPAVRYTTDVMLGVTPETDTMPESSPAKQPTKVAEELPRMAAVGFVTMVVVYPDGTTLVQQLPANHAAVRALESS